MPGALRVSPTLREDLQHRLFVEARDRAECGVGVHVEVEVIVDPIDGAGRVELVDQVDHDVDRLDGADVRRGSENAQCRHVVAEQLGLALGQLYPVDAGGGRTFEQRVVDVGDVLGVA